MADIVVTAANVVADAGATIVSGTFGATVTAGQSVYKDAADGNKWKPADANVAASEAGNAGIGVALNGGSDGQPADILQGGDYTAGGTVAAGVVYVVSDTAGGIAPDADILSGSFKTVLGVGISTTKIKLAPIVSGFAVA